MHLLANHPDIQLSDVLGKYILTTLTSNSVINYVPNISYVFNHFFEYSTEPMVINGIDFSSYTSYLKTRNKKLYDQDYARDGYSQYDD